MYDNRIFELTAGCDDEQITFAAIQEHRWPTQEEIGIYSNEGKTWTFIHSSAIDGQGGVGILFPYRLNKNIADYKKIHHLILQVDTTGNPAVSLITAHAPHGGYPYNDRKEFYDTLKAAIKAIPKHNIILVGGDLNAHIGKDLGDTHPQTFGPHFYYTSTKLNSNGSLLADLCTETGMTSVQTHFQYPANRLWTHLRPNGAKEQLDHVLINTKWINSTQNCRAYSRVETNSDH